MVDHMQIWRTRLLFICEMRRFIIAHKYKNEVFREPTDTYGKREIKSN